MASRRMSVTPFAIDPDPNADPNPTPKGVGCPWVFYVEAPGKAVYHSKVKPYDERDEGFGSVTRSLG